jgi:hypothetical protein
MDATTIVEMITAVGALGTAATGLVDITKILGSGVSYAGYPTIKQQLLPFDKLLEAIPDGAAYETIYGLWINGAPIEDQKAKVKALIKMGFAPATVPEMVTATRLTKDELDPLATSIANGVDLTKAQINIYGRLDAILSAVIDAAYEQADQRYRNAAKATAAAIAIVLALLGGYVLNGSAGPQDPHVSYWLCFLMGAIATPLAPVAKDITTAINTAVQSSGQLRALLK